MLILVKQVNNHHEKILHVPQTIWSHTYMLSNRYFFEVKHIQSNIYTKQDQWPL